MCLVWGVDWISARLAGHGEITISASGVGCTEELGF